MTMSREELRAALRGKLEAAVRERLRVEGEKKDSNDEFNRELKGIDKGIEDIIEEFDDCQASLPFGEDVALIGQR